MGRIGAEVAKRALAFEMRVVAFDPYLTDERAKELDLEKVELEQAFNKADYITVHMPLTDEARNMVDESALGNEGRCSYI